MNRFTKSSLFLTLLYLLQSASGEHGYALDAPHNAANSISCSTNCHDLQNPTWRSRPTGTPTIDNTYANNLCKSCHIVGSSYVDDPIAQDVQTHSSVQTSENYGQWSMECRTCHNPHYQKQISTYATTSLNSLVTGTVLTVALPNRLTVQVSSLLTASAHVGNIIIPDVSSPFLLYQVTDNTGGATPEITVSSKYPLNPFYVKPGNQFAIRYGGLVKELIYTPRSGPKAVRFFNNAGPNSFASGTAVVDGVCQVCHTKTRYFRNDGSVLDAGHPAPAGVNCTASCHQHNVGFKANCGMCHGSPPVVNSVGPPSGLVLTGGTGSTGSKLAGTHARHANSLGIECRACHANAAGSGTLHNDGTLRIKIGFVMTPASITGGRYDGQTAPVYLASHAATSVVRTGTMRCSNVYCHSMGQGLTGTNATPLYSNPSWTIASTGSCGTCHGINGASITTGNHTPHLTFTGFSISCGDCHTGASASSYTSPNHVNGQIDVAMGYTLGGPGGNGYGSCGSLASPIVCHGNGTPQWGMNTSPMLDKCTVCHGTPTVGALGSSASWSMAPPLDTSQTNSLNKVGAHSTHVTTNTIGRALRCDECHTVPAFSVAGIAGHIVDSTPGKAEVTFATSTIAGTNAAVPGYSGGVCSNVYCHGAAMWKGPSDGTDTTPAWNDTSYINGTITHDCGQCHGFPPLPAVINSHSGPITQTDCATCHSNVRPSGTGFWTVSLHVNGVLEPPLNCNACHGTSNPWGAPFTGGDRVSPSTGHAAGAHEQHVSTVTGAGFGSSCGICHSGYAMDTGPTRSMTLLFNVNSVKGYALPAGGSYQGISFSSASYTYRPLWPTGAVQVCSNLYCHGATMAPNGGTDITPEWTNGTTGACGTCHGASASAPPTRGSHVKHARTTNLGYGYPCGLCHRDPAVDASLHVNNRSEIIFSTNPLTNGGISSGTPTMLDAYGTCTNIYCHSSVQTSPPGGTPIYAMTPTWGSSVSGCNACHLYSGAAFPPLTGSHAKHFVYPEMQECYPCHNYNTTDDPCFACHDAAVNPQRDRHANRSIDVGFAPKYGGNYSGTPAPGDAYGQCATVYCHSNAQSSPPGSAVTYTSPTWGNAASGQCGTCHRADGVQGNGTLMASGTHPAHVGLLTPSGDRVYSCSICHAGKGAGSNAHADKKIDVAFDAAYGGTYTGTPAPGDAYGTCRNIYCHSTVQGASDPTQPPVYRTPVWGQSFSGTCGLGACHPVGFAHTEDASSPNYSLLTTGSHAKHLKYKFDQLGNCEACHYKTGNCQDCHVMHGGETHVDRVITIAFDPYFPAMPTGGGGGSYSGDTVPQTAYGSCTNLYCHSPGTALAPPYGAPHSGIVTWGSGSLTADCSGCHGGDRNASVPILSGSHYNHVVTSGIDCSACHANTVSNSRTLNPSVYNGARTYGYHYHVNGWINIVFSGIAGTSGTYAGQASPVPNRAPGSPYGICGNLYCHGATLPGGTNTSPVWGGTAPCGSCHAATTATLTSGSHATHLTATRGPNGSVPGSVDCSTCHGVGATAGTHGGHVDGISSFADGTSLAYTTVCNGCHSPDGPVNGVVSTWSSSMAGTSVGAKDNWQYGVYSGNTLTPGKEKWCVGCHDSGSSTFSGRQAPSLDQYYISGHGSSSTYTECGGCHDLGRNHNLDGVRTYSAAANNYQTGYRLMSVSGQPPLAIPKTVDGCDYDRNDYALCFNCHSSSPTQAERDLLSDSKAQGVYGCTTNTYNSAATITTRFRNVSMSGFGASESDVPANAHWDHLVDIHSISFGAAYWDSDKDGTNDSKTTCVTCHNPHGAVHSNGTATVPTIRMTRQGLDIYSVVTATQDYGYDGPNRYFPCFNCHFSGSGAYYRQAPADLATFGVTLSDNAPNDPKDAETGFTNKRNIDVTLQAFGLPTEMTFAEDASFTTNSTGWIPFVSRSSYTLSNGDGGHTVYAKVRNFLTPPSGSAAKSAIITLDTTTPLVPPNALISPNGGELVNQGTATYIMWRGLDQGVVDANLKTNPITLLYSTNSGLTYTTIASSLPHTMGTNTYVWNPAPLIETTTARMQLAVTDRAGNQLADASDADFTIRAVIPLIGTLSVYDNNNSDPAPAEAGYTNTRPITVETSAGNFPTTMTVAEDASFTTNTTGWIPYASRMTYTLTAGDGAKTVFVKIRNAAGESAPMSMSITLDTTAPTVNPGAITAPLAGAAWPENSSQVISWLTSGSDINDVNLKANPVNLGYLVDSRVSSTISIAIDQPNTGAVTWNPVNKPATFRARVVLTAQDRAGNRTSVRSAGDFRITTPYRVTSVADSGGGSLRDVLSSVIAAGGNDTIWFDITSGLTNGVAVINLASSLPTITAPGITIDGESQTILRGNTNTRGPEVRLHGNYGFSGLTLNADNATIRGMQFTNFYFYGIEVTGGNNAVIEGNHIGFWSDSATNYTGQGCYYGLNLSWINGGGLNHRVGGTLPESPNYISGNVRSGITAYTVPGLSILNNYVGLLPEGNVLSNGVFYEGIGIYSNDVSIRGNQFAGNSQSAAIGLWGSNITIKGNMTGIYFNGTTLSQRTAPMYGIWTTTGLSNIAIGGPNRAMQDTDLGIGTNDSNVLTAQATNGNGIYLASSASIQGNYIGTNPATSQSFTTGVGILVSANTITIGGTGAGEAGNVISHMATTGVVVVSGSSGVKISRNSLFSNGTGTSFSDDGIYLAPGANNDITRPSIISATISNVTVTGVQSGDIVEVFVSDYDGTGTEYGEGRTFIGGATASGISVPVPVSGVSVGQWVTATRTSSGRNTSAFSSNVRVQ